jgi:hypothetical protein
VLGILILVKEVQLRNIFGEIFVTRFPKVTLAKLLHPKNTAEPIDEKEVLPLLNVTLVIFTLGLNAKPAIIETA